MEGEGPPPSAKPMDEKIILAASSPKLSNVSGATASEILEQVDRKKERALLWKLDWHVLPMISILYMLSFVDRINIGNAKIQGLDTDLKMSGSDYNVALFVFFIPYILFEVPSNLLLKRMRPSTWLSWIMLGWGRCKGFCM